MLREIPLKMHGTENDEELYENRCTPLPDPVGAPPSDGGWTMTEIVVAIALMGSIIVAIIGGMFAVVRASAANDEAAKVQAVLGSAADRIANYKYLECPRMPDAYSDYNAVSYARVGKAAVESVGWDESTVQITNYEFWNPDTNSWQASNSLAGCRLQCFGGTDHIEDHAEDHRRGDRSVRKHVVDTRHREVRHPTQGGPRCFDAVTIR